jgi:hypothetical protein
MANIHSPINQDNGGTDTFNPYGSIFDNITFTPIIWDNIINLPSFCNVATTANYNDLSNNAWININSDIYNSNIGNIGIGTTNPNYKLDIIGNINYSGILYQNGNDIIDTASNNLNTKIISLSTDTLPIGINNKFITNNTYNNQLTIDGELTTSNIYATDCIINDKSVNARIDSTINTLDAFIGTVDANVKAIYSILNNSNIERLFIVNQSDSNTNVAEFYNSNNPTFIITSNSNIVICKYNPNINYQLDINGSLNATNIYLNNNSLDIITSNSSNDAYTNLNTIILNNYCKKSTFTFNTSGSTTYNSISYFSYDIILSNYIKSMNVNENTILYKFRIHTAKKESFFSESSIEECDYLIMMSEISGNGANNGVKIRALGTPNDSNLNIGGNNCLIKTETFGIIRYLSTTENTTILCTIIDEL